MGKQQTKLKSFFDGERRRFELKDMHVLKDENEVRRIQLFFIMPLSGEPVIGMPDEFMDQFLVMDKEKSALNSAKSEVMLEGATFRIYATDDGENLVVDGNSATLRAFRFVGEGVESKRTVKLEFVIYAPYTVALRDWACDNLHYEFFVEVESTQAEIEEVAGEPVQQALPVN